MENENAWIEIQYDHLQHNVLEIKKLLPKKTTFMAVVKANAYGHGLIQVATYLNTIGITSFGVARIEEAVELRKAGIKGEILVFGYTSPDQCQVLSDYDIMQTVVDVEHARALEEMNIPIKVHIKIDTGMHRLGIDFQRMEELVAIFQYRYLCIEGMYTHLCVCDSQQQDDVDFTNQQIDAFYQVIESLKVHQIKVPKIHIQSSYGVLNYPLLSCDYARIGIAMYGILSTDDHRTIRKVNLKPVLSIKAKVISIRTVPAGETIGYGRTYVCHNETQVAVIPVGYADGIPRNFETQGGYVIIRGQKVPIVGRICMDQMTIDISQYDVKIGDTVTVIGHKRDSISVENIATMCDTITNEVLSRLNNRLPRIDIKAKKIYQTNINYSKKSNLG